MAHLSSDANREEGGQADVVQARALDVVACGREYGKKVNVVSSRIGLLPSVFCRFVAWIALS